MKAVALACIQCGGSLAESSKFCPCCGTPVKVDDARIREADVHEKVRLKELEIEFLKMQTETRQKQNATASRERLAVSCIAMIE